MMPHPAVTSSVLVRMGEREADKGERERERREKKLIFSQDECGQI